MIKTIISRDDHVYACFPDIARTPGGTLVCVYRECMMHAPFPFSRIAVRRSLDGGMSWSDRQLLVECVHRAELVDQHRSWVSKDAIVGYEETRSRVEQDWRQRASINCPRLICLADASLFLIADLAIYDDAGQYSWQNMIWRSHDDGDTWTGPQEAEPLRGLLVPSVNQLRNGDIMVGLCRQEGSRETQLVLRSSDGGHSWASQVRIPDPEALDFSEGSFVELDNGTILGVLRAGGGQMGYKILSRDGGRTWTGPFPTHLAHLAGRPKAGLLASGEVCVTYRCCMPNEFLAMHVMTQGAAELEKLGLGVVRQPMSEDIPARLASKNGEPRPEYMTSYYPGRTFILDCDRSIHPDCGYSGWVQLPSGDIYVVDYVNDDAPLAQIRGYLLQRRDYVLFPDGELPWLHPSWQPFREMSAAMAARQSANPLSPQRNAL